MGFRCPNCHKDFGTDKAKLGEHLANHPECGKKDWIKDSIQQNILNLLNRSLKG